MSFSEVIEGTWEEVREMLIERSLEHRVCVGAKRVRLIIQHFPQEDVVLVVEGAAAIDGGEPARQQEWLKNLRAWAASHPKLDHEVDDSRDTIYAEVVRDPR